MQSRVAAPGFAVVTAVLVAATVATPHYNSNHGDGVAVPMRGYPDLLRVARAHHHVAPDQRHFRVDDLATTVKYNHSILDLSYINIITLHLISTTNSVLPLYQFSR